MHNNISTTLNENNSNTYNIIRFTEETRIKNAVTHIPKNCICKVTDISPNAHYRENTYNSGYLKDHYNEILGAVPLKHGFIVKKCWENWWKDTIIIAYMGPIAHVVNKILHTIN